MATDKDDFKPGLILFDVYETLMDMSNIQRRINSVLDSKRGFTIWFELLMQYCFLDNCVGQFHPFPDICKATLHMSAKSLGKTVSDHEVDDMLHLMKHLPLHDGVPEALSALKDAGYRLAALTNAPAQVVQERMERTGLISYFDGVMSGEEIKKFKPACEVYQWAAQKMAVPTDDCLLVTAHPWDVAGAHYAGMKTAFIQRPQQMAYPLAPPPDFIAPKLHLLVERLVVTAS
ncbi:haloacid dehalogenase type II [Pseudocnuella soli]|uniref:haloacid dehalogenase type II n=1 Tax=Pseudocnuella soli TaxID=2502779 RepID=UPI001050C07C|nr:haloacid dehalogenase type II [Pseudocnuella soli]